MKDKTQISKFLSLILRHKPHEANIMLDENGWTNVAILLKNVKITKAELDSIVDTNDKKRFAYNKDQTMIRASQGHSVNVDLNIEPIKPPEFLYHGTTIQNITSIFKTGLEKRKRQHVHLSENFDTAINVGSRYGKPEVLVVKALEMFNNGFSFYKSENNVWLTNSVPFEYLTQKMKD
jgi:putative RNA 2'-phosphotransferase